MPMHDLTLSIRFLLVLLMLSTASSVVDDDGEDDALLRRILHKKPVATQFRKDSTDEQSLETRAVFQESQRQRLLAADRDGKNEIYLARHDETIDGYNEWVVESDQEFYQKAYGVIDGCTPRNLSSRRVRDFFADEVHCSELVDATENAMINLFHRGGTTSIAPCHKQSQDRLGVKGALLFDFLLHKTKLQIMRDYNLSMLFTSGALLTRLIADPPMDKWDMDPNHVYWNAHVDKANIPTYDYSALLYLNTHGANFSGGELEFVDDDANRVIEPRAGRLVTFASGAENLHRVRKVLRGRRYVLAMWFTCSQLHRYNDDESNSAQVAEQVSTLRRLNEDLMEANDVILRASEKLRVENEQLRAIGKVCLANGGLDGGGGVRGRGRKAAGRGAGGGHEEMLGRMALDRRLAAEVQLAKKRLAAARQLASEEARRDKQTRIIKERGTKCYDVESCSSESRDQDAAFDQPDRFDQLDVTSLGHTL